MAAKTAKGGWRVFWFGGKRDGEHGDNNAENKGKNDEDDDENDDADGGNDDDAGNAESDDDEDDVGSEWRQQWAGGFSCSDMADLSTHHKTCQLSARMTFWSRAERPRERPEGYWMDGGKWGSRIGEAEQVNKRWTGIKAAMMSATKRMKEAETPYEFTIWRWLNLKRLAAIAV